MGQNRTGYGGCSVDRFVVGISGKTPDCAVDERHGVAAAH